MHYNILCFITIGLSLFSCKSDRPNPNAETVPISINSNSQVLVVNEGIFQNNNASISFFNAQLGQVSNDIFTTVNGRPLGDVAQSVTVWNDRIYAVINNSSKIEIIDKSSFRSIGTISGLGSPRYMLPVSHSKAYVTDIYTNKISVLDLNTLKVVKTIPCKGWTERLVYHLGKVYVTNYWQSFLYVIDPLKDVIADSIYVGKGAQSIVTDKKDRLVVTCGGYKTPQSATRIVFISAYDKTIEKAISFPTNSPSSLNINATKDSIYFLNKDVYKMSIEDNSLPAPFVSAKNRQYYGLGIDPITNQIFVADAIDYVQKGKVYIYSSSGREIGSFQVGINPSDFYFFR